MFLEVAILTIFGVALVGALLFHIPIVYALLWGLVLFAGYALWRKFSLWQILATCGRGVYATRGLLLLFILVGALTSLWRASGTIPVIVSYAVTLVNPQSFILVVFLLNAAMSLMTGTALGTAATMGVICGTMAGALNVDPAWTGGAILAGVYFGNRLSPISTMALLTANVTGSNIYRNVRNMIQTTWVPLLLSVAVYALAGFCFLDSCDGAIPVEMTQSLFAKEFSLSLWGLSPAILMVALSLLRVRSSRVLLSSLLCAFTVALVVENHSLSVILEAIVYGFHSHDSELNRLIAGGGILSMTNVFLIVVIAGCYSGIFKMTEILKPLKAAVENLEKRTSPFASTLMTSIAVACVSCNQTLTIMLTNQLTQKNNPCENEAAREKQALNLYDSAVTVIALVPWSVATSMVLVSSNAPATSVFYACFLYLLPICRLVNSGSLRHRIEIGRDC